MKKRILVTGGAGFIGSHLCELLLTKGYVVICMDNLITGSFANIRHLRELKGFTFVRYDVSTPIAMRGRLDYILHFASPASPVDYLKLPIETLMVGSRGTHHALELARQKKAVFLLASTSEVYGDPLVHPQQESYWGNVNPIGPRSVYDEAKRFAEALTMAYQRTYGVDTKIVRIFNTYGERMRANDGRAIPNFIAQLNAGRPLTVYGNGSQTRSFCYVSDLVDGIYRLMRSRIHEPVNIGNPREFTILTLAHLMVRLSGGRTKIVFRPLPVDDPKLRRPDIGRARQLLGWQPKVALEEGLRRTIAWHDDENKRARSKVCQYKEKKK